MEVAAFSSRGFVDDGTVGTSIENNIRNADDLLAIILAGNYDPVHCTACVRCLDDSRLFQTEK